jgi:hypothetical protein
MFNIMQVKSRASYQGKVKSQRMLVNELRLRTTLKLTTFDLQLPERTLSIYDPV